MVGSSLYTESMRRNEIQLSRQIIDFLSKQGRYIPILRKGGQNIKLSYCGIEGDNPISIPDEYSENPALEDTEEYPLENTDPSSQNRAERMSIYALKFLFDGSSQYSDIRRIYMINTGTIPIKVTFTENDKKSKKKMFVKRPDTNRIIGRFLYDVISECPPIKWGFNRAVFLEEGIHGSLLSRVNEKLFLGSRQYKDGIMKAAVHVAALGLYKDVVRPRNRIIGPNLETILFDFNVMFDSTESSKGDSLIEQYRKEPHFIDDQAIAAYLQERREVAKRLERAHKTVFKFAEIAGSLVDSDSTYKSLNQRIKEGYGARTLTEYLEKLIETYSQT